MSHLTFDQIEDYVEGVSPQLDAHIASCPRCRRELATMGRLTRALSHLERVTPSPSFSAELDRALAQSAVQPQPASRPDPSFAWTGLATFLASVLLLAFSYQTLVALQEGGTVDFVSRYFSRPDLVSTYPSEAFGALLESLPIVELAWTGVILLIAIVLFRELLRSRRVI